MKNKKSIAILMAAITLASCQSYKKVPYLQSYESLTDKSYKEIVINEVNQQDTLYDARIQPKDLLNITINTTDPQAAAPFNLTMQTYNNIAQSNASTTSQPALQQYLVDNAGEIDFPVIGRLQVGGLTKNAAENLIREQQPGSVTVHSVHSNALRDAQKSCIRMISRRNSRVFCELCSQKTPRGTLPVNSNFFITCLCLERSERNDKKYV